MTKLVPGWCKDVDMTLRAAARVYVHVYRGVFVGEV